MKFVSLAVLALIGDESAVRKVHALAAAKNELQDADYYDRSFEEKEAKEMIKEQLPINKFDGLIHAQNGKIYDPETMKEVELNTESSAVQINDWYDDDFDRTSTFTGEPIATVQKRIALLQMDSQDWFDNAYERDQ